jgi:hypothetical protein
MPFGLKTAPGTFQRYMDHALQGTEHTALWYLDDILIFGETLDGLRRGTRQVKARLASNGSVINEDKSEYEARGLLFAGLWIYGRGQGPNFEKTRQVLSLPPPANKKEMQSALGLVSYLRDHIPLASQLTAAISGEVFHEGFASLWEKFKREIANRITTLGQWNEKGEAELYTDASGYAIGVVLIQNQRIVALASRKFSPAETRYSATDREQLSLAYAAEKFRIFLHRPTITRTHNDHAALVNRNVSKLTPRQARAHEKITQWIPNILHVKGENNPADYISRWMAFETGGSILA